MFFMRKEEEHHTRPSKAIARALCRILSRDWNAVECFSRALKRSPTKLECMLCLLFRGEAPGARWDGVTSTTWMEEAQP